MSQIVIDRNSLQARQHLQGNAIGQTICRLTTFVGLIEELGHSVRFENLLDPNSGLNGADLLIILTRPQGLPIDPFLKGIQQFVQDGGSLFLLSNHSRAPTYPKMGNFMIEDRKLARLFGIELIEACFQTDQNQTLTNISDMGKEIHPLLTNEDGERIVNTVVINNGCAIDQNSSGTPVLLLPEDLIDIGPSGKSSKGHAFCWANEIERGGRILVTGDSGFVGEPNLQGTGPGLIDQRDNMLFIKQSIGWLLTGLRSDLESLDYS